MARAQTTGGFTTVEDYLAGETVTIESVSASMAVDEIYRDINFAASGGAEAV